MYQLKKLNINIAFEPAQIPHSGMCLKTRGRNAQKHTDACVLAKENNAAQRSTLGCTQRTRYSTTEKNTILMRAALQQTTKERKKRKGQE